MVEVDQRIGRRFQSVLPQIPGRTPSETVHRDLRHPDRALVTQQAVHPREEFDQLASPLLQPYGPVFGHMKLLTDLRPERWPLGRWDQVGVWIGIAPALGHPDIPGPEGAPQFP